MFITPNEDSSVVGGFCGGDADWNSGLNDQIDWCIGNKVPYGVGVSNDMVFSTNVGGFNNPADWIERMRITKDGNVGIGTTSIEFKLTIDKGATTPDGGILAIGTYGFGANLSTGTGTQLIWYPKKAAFRAGRSWGTEWDNVNIGDYSVAMGSNTKASGRHSFAMGGDNVVASGDYSVAMGGPSTNATEDNSLAIGRVTTANGFRSVAIGGYTTANGQYSTAMNYNNQANGYFSTAMGYTTTAQAYASTVLGRYNVISGSQTSWVDTDPLLVIGNGASPVSPSNAMTVLKNGNVGIGMTIPQSTLQVSGYIQLALTSGTPPSLDCDEVSERGRMKVDSIAGLLYICVDSGWVSK